MKVVGSHGVVYFTTIDFYSFNFFHDVCVFFAKDGTFATAIPISVGFKYVLAQLYHFFSTFQSDLPSLNPKGMVKNHTRLKRNHHGRHPNCKLPGREQSLNIYHLKNHGISKLGLWRSLNPCLIQIQTLNFSEGPS